ncbi:MAG: hypothetical protein KAS32_27250 [Candidatus Peribacteraceae bacterium]|nr:hypothetical protein [Candidatus Peribacteraceae bacterium]
MKITDRDVEIKLFPVAHLEPKIKNIFEAFLEINNKKSIVMPDGSKRKLTISLITNRTLEVANV